MMPMRRGAPAMMPMPAKTRDARRAENSSDDEDGNP